MRVWTKPELIVDELALSQHYAEDCTEIAGYNVSCTSTTGNATGHKKNKETVYYGDRAPGYMSKEEYDKGNDFLRIHGSGGHGHSFSAIPQYKTTLHVS